MLTCGIITPAVRFALLGKSDSVLLSRSPSWSCRSVSYLTGSPISLGSILSVRFTLGLISTTRAPRL
ncbi:unnamed protein product [Protopolystoma xenopodis]|uniref:Uncharacterized protein n=1 Tax=Protopolystoma xenopodis TaxID=117903 RepID=A0A3S5B2X7_9PLAT|nr:unnamed protein product [Protopolystoma xenopodis]